MKVTIGGMMTGAFRRSEVQLPHAAADEERGRAEGEQSQYKEGKPPVVAA